MCRSIALVKLTVRYGRAGFQLPVFAEIPSARAHPPMSFASSVHQSSLVSALQTSFPRTNVGWYRYTSVKGSPRTNRRSSKRSKRNFQGAGDTCTHCSLVSFCAELGLGFGFIGDHMKRRLRLISVVHQFFHIPPHNYLDLEPVLMSETDTFFHSRRGLPST